MRAFSDFACPRIFDETCLRIDVVEQHDLGAGVFELHQGRPQNMEAALAGCVGNNVDLF